MYVNLEISHVDGIDSRAGSRLSANTVAMYPEQHEWMPAGMSLPTQQEIFYTSVEAEFSDSLNSERIGMAIKYAGLRGKEVRVIGKK